MLTTIDLFAGAGGLSSGFQQTGKYDIKAAFENNPVMQETYRKNHPNVEVYGDVCQADYNQLQDKFGPIDVVIGGPPCQGFSNANRQRNHAVSHNNSMVKEYVRAIVQLKPIAFVMENVSMLSSNVHRFYLCENDKALINSGKIKTKATKLVLLDKEYIFDGILDIIENREQVLSHLWMDSDFHDLNVIYKAEKNAEKIPRVLSRYQKKLLRAAKSHTPENFRDDIDRTDADAYTSVQKYFDGKINEEVLLSAIRPAIMYQKMLRKIKEIYDNEIVVDKYYSDDGIYADIQSYAVFDYFNAMLDDYIINSGVLSAADFGVPQRRMRFVAIGIRKGTVSEVKLPGPIFEEKEYRTVSDAISDLADIQPKVNIADDTGIPIKKEKELSDLALSLRDSPVLYNHVVTKTTDIALERFHNIEQGKNFHSLSENMKINTYTDSARTQNTIYLRLKNDEPSGTVINVRKSMWIHPTIDRAISIREAARLQTFHDSFIFTGSKDKQYQQVGNAVPPLLAEAIAQALAEQLDCVNSKECEGNGRQPFKSCTK